MSEQTEGHLLSGRYRLGKPLGRGGMAVVYEAEDLRMGREVAVKVWRGDASEVHAERLYREARAAARTNHPALITVFDFGRDPVLEAGYVVMELLRGEDLSERLERTGRQTVEFVQRLGCEVSDALAAVHAVNVVHRDLKPANIFLARRGLRVDELKLLDFGIARHLDLHSLTSSQDIVGSPAYMAPEQLRAPKLVDARSDIYALGVVLYECLTGSAAFPARSVFELATRILRADLQPLAVVCPELPRGLVEVVDRCLHSEPGARFADARELCEALQRLS